MFNSNGTQPLPQMSTGSTITSPGYTLLRIYRVPGHRLDLQLHIKGFHWHHGATGALLFLFPRTRKLGLALMAHDWHDFPWLPVRHTE